MSVVVNVLFLPLTSHYILSKHLFARLIDTVKFEISLLKQRKGLLFFLIVLIKMNVSKPFYFLDRNL